MDREEKSKQPITRFVRVRGEIRWEKKVNNSWTQSSVIGKDEVVNSNGYCYSNGSGNLNSCLKRNAYGCVIQQER